MSEHASSLRQSATSAARADALLPEVTALIVEALNLTTPAAQIDADAPLYGEGLGLDSIDILEIGLVVSRHYGIQLRADGEENRQVFRSLRHLVGHIAANRTK
jgi:acyl carrier protein